MSQDELVDIVDENMNFVRVARKGDAHREGWLHKTVIGVVINSEGDYLLVKQSKDRQDPGQYVSPAGGHVTAGESDEDALKREVFEELGMRGFNFEFTGKGIFNREVVGRKENHYFIVYKVFSDEKPILSHEAESFRYFSEEELKREIKDNPKIFGDAFHFGATRFLKHLYD